MPTIPRILALILIVSTPRVWGRPCGGDRSEEWTRCRTDSDCLVYESVCFGGWQAIRRDSLKAVDTYNRCMRPMIRCLPLHRDKTKLAAACVAGKCTLKDIATGKLLQSP